MEHRTGLPNPASSAEGRTGKSTEDYELLKSLASSISEAPADIATGKMTSTTIGASYNDKQAETSSGHHDNRYHDRETQAEQKQEAVLRPLRPGRSKTMFLSSGSISSPAVSAGPANNLPTSTDRVPQPTSSSNPPAHWSKSTSRPSSSNSGSGDTSLPRQHRAASIPLSSSPTSCSSDVQVQSSRLPAQPVPEPDPPISIVVAQTTNSTSTSTARRLHSKQASTGSADIGASVSQPQAAESQSAFGSRRLTLQSTAARPSLLTKHLQFKSSSAVPTLNTTSAEAHLRSSSSTPLQSPSPSSGPSTRPGSSGSALALSRRGSMAGHDLSATDLLRSAIIHNR
jgi:hypothetical protein